MVAQFNTLDGTLWSVDTENMTWEGGGDSGELTFQNNNIYHLSPRVPTTEGPGAGLCTVLVTSLPVGQILWMYLQANVPTRNFTMPKPITQIRYEIIGAPK